MIHYALVKKRTIPFVRDFWRTHYNANRVRFDVDINESRLPPESIFIHCVNIKQLVMAHNEHGNIIGVAIGITPYIAIEYKRYKSLILTACDVIQSPYFMFPMHVVDPNYDLEDNTIAKQLLDTLIKKVDKYYLKKIVFISEGVNRDDFYQDKYGCELLKIIKVHTHELAFFEKPNCLP